MNINYNITLFIAFSALTLFGCSPTTRIHKPDKELLQIIDQNVNDAAAQYRIMKEKLPPDRFPKTWHADKDELETSDSGWWCSGFYPGVLLYLFEETRDLELYDEAMRILKVLEKEQYNTTTHDLGFMMFNSFGAANKINPKAEYKEILINSAKSLASRFSPTVGLIKSWDSKEGDYLVIIDNMMNLELLFWAARATGDSSFYDIAVTHADNTIKNHFRDDYSSYHVLNYDPETGAVNEKRTAQGYSYESAWARGQAWGLYGFVVTYRETKEKRYLEQARHIADFILSHPNLPEDKVPYWDFNAPNIPNALRDASAGAIIASALMELNRYVDPKTANHYLSVTETILKTLSSPEYKAETGTNGGFILKHGVGHFPHGTEIDVPLTYADYYFVEAMKRYEEMFELNRNAHPPPLRS